MSDRAKDVWKIQDFRFRNILIQIIFKHFGKLKLSGFPFLHSKKMRKVKKYMPRKQLWR